MGIIESEQRGGALRLVIDDPEHDNALDYAALVELLERIEAAAEDDSVRAVCLAGRGADFCPGERIDDMGAWPARFAARHHGGADDASDVVHQAVVSAWWRMPKPTMAVLTGRTAGFGFDLACAADLRIAAADARVGDGRIQNGAMSGTGTAYLLPRLIGLSQANRFLLLGDEVDAAEAHRIAFVHDVIGTAELDQRVSATLQRLAGMATRSYALIKQQLQEQLDLPYDMALLHSLAVRQTNVIEDVAEGIAAFREKRAPRFTGR